MRGLKHFLGSVSLLPLLTGLFSVGLAPQAVAQDENPSFTLHVSAKLVSMPFRVLEKNGTPVSQVNQSDIEVFDNGVQAPKFRLDPAEAKVNIVLLADLSGSMSGNLDQLKASLWDFVQQTRPQDTITLIPFSETAVPFTRFETDRAKIKSAIDRIQIIGVEHTFQVIKATEEVLLKPHYGEHNVIAILTDGNELGSPEMFPQALQSVLEQGSTVYPIIYSGEHLNMKQFEKIAKASGGDVIRAGGMETLSAAYAEMLGKLRAQFSLSFPPKMQAGDSHVWHNVDIRIKGKDNYRIISRRGYCPESPCQVANGDFVGKAPQNIREAFALSRDFPADFVDESLTHERFRARDQITLNDTVSSITTDGKKVETEADSLKNQCIVSQPKSEVGRELKVNANSICDVDGKGQYGYWEAPNLKDQGYFASQIGFKLSCHSGSDAVPLQVTCRWPSRLLTGDVNVRTNALINLILESETHNALNPGVKP